ncbi:cysteine-rich receptor-like protein kinase 6 isoform X2 [Cryptomeria japonica]|uniref:cysteine-rich receptor-like protein kinase 6 isoform X2 n=1 Tax=Cryptomeria japonica TaxID=3369 RepID=UPI0027DA3373|nr:cysteine-rich receptor-like protein kinase 6 isoform X2 [Cryptomeria japonica]
MSKPTPTTGLSSLPLDLLIRYIDNVLSGIINQGLGCKIIDSGTELRDLVQPVASDFSKLFDGISDAAKMFSDQKFLKSQLSTEAHSVAVDVLKGLGNAHWVAVGLLAIANVLERFDNISANDRECIDLLKAMLKLGKYLKQMKDISADLHKETSECMSEAVKLIVSGAILCCSFITSNKLSKFLLTRKIRDELVYVRGKVDSMKADLMLQMQVLTITTFTSYHRQNNVTGGKEDNNFLRITDQDHSEQSKDTNKLEGSESDTVSSEGQHNYSVVNEPELLKRPLSSSLGLGRFLKKKIPTIFGLQKPSIEFKCDELKRATKGFTKDSNNIESIMLVKEIQTFPIEFKSDELKRATKGFTKQIGEGGFGRVYYGILSDGKRVAIKKSSIESRQGKIEWMNELTTLSKLCHRNIIELVGYCSEEDGMLVYDYLPRTLSSVIFGENEMIMDWPKRLKIILDIIRGLAYLHEGADACIVHRDVKPSNILLDENFNAKISDFGLARVMRSDHVQYVNMEVYENGLLFLKDATNFISHESTRVAGTLGYMAPEYALRGRLSTKSDVYSFGVTLLEIASGRKIIDTTFDGRMLVEHAWRLYEKDRLHELIDPRLLSTDGLIYSSSVSRTVKIGLCCTHCDYARRPSVSRVLAMLLSEEKIPNLS